MTAGKRNPIKKGPIILKNIYKKALAFFFCLRGENGYKYKEEKERKNYGQKSF